MIDIAGVYAEIVLNCRNDCADADMCLKYFKRRNRPLTRAQVYFIKTLNFSAIRENVDALSIAFGVATAPKQSSIDFLSELHPVAVD